MRRLAFSIAVGVLCAAGVASAQERNNRWLYCVFDEGNTLDMYEQGGRQVAILNGQQGRFMTRPKPGEPVSEIGFEIAGNMYLVTLDREASENNASLIPRGGRGTIIGAVSGNCELYDR